ncbi:MAG: winged helix DNA-binding domain-containing protein [Chloroflexi bacterium]|nr:winged helix DNA-binding domain-containing protein [Chloroflexota bacterium]
MTPLASETLLAHRAQTFRLHPHLRLHKVEDARTFVEERGFIFFWPIKGVTFPSLWTAVAGDRPVASAHNDPGHVTWGWKDQALDKRWWYYAKILRGRATLISLKDLPYFYALSDNFGEPESDYLLQYQDGVLSREARLIYEILLNEGPLDTVTMRRKLHMTGKASNSPFDRALTYLQRDFKILPVGVAQTGAWRYSFIYECTHRWFPELAETARPIPRRKARAHLLLRYLQSMGAATEADMRKIFQWPRPDLQQAMQDLLAQGDCCETKVSGQSGDFYALPALCAQKQ